MALEAEMREATEKHEAESQVKQAQLDRVKSDLEDAEDELVPMRRLLGYTQAKAQALCTLGTVGIKAYHEAARATKGGKGKRDETLVKQLAAHESAMLKVKQVDPAKNADGLTPLQQLHRVMRDFLEPTAKDAVPQSDATIDLVRGEEGIQAAPINSHASRKATIAMILKRYE